MSSGLEPVDIVDPWLWTTLSTDDVMKQLVKDRIANGGALGAFATPFVTWDMNSSTDVTGSNGLAIFNESLFEIKAIGQGGSYASVAPVARRVHQLLGEATNVETPNGVVTCRRDRVIRYVELDDNVQYRHLGGIYRITAHARS